MVSFSLGNHLFNTLLSVGGVQHCLGCAQERAGQLFCWTSQVSPAALLNLSGQYSCSAEPLLGQSNCSAEPLRSVKLLCWTTQVSPAPLLNLSVQSGCSAEPLSSVQLLCWTSQVSTAALLNLSGQSSCSAEPLRSVQLRVGHRVLFCSVRSVLFRS